MKICYVGRITFPEGFAPTKRFYDIFNLLRKRGHEIHLVIPELGKHPTFFQSFFRFKWKTKKRYVKNIQVHRVSRQITFFSNILFTSFYIVDLIRKESIDVIVAHSPSIFAGFPAFIAAKITRKPFVLQYLDPLFIGGGNLTFFGKIAEKIELLLPEKADAVFAISKTMYEEILIGRVNESKVHFIYPAVDIEKIGKKVTKDKRFNNIFSITYAGTFCKSEGLKYLIESIYHLKNRIPNIRLFLVGGTHEGLRDEDVEDISGLIKKYELQKHVVQLGFVSPYEKIPKILQSSDILCAPQLDNFANRVAFSSKIPEYLASGIPVITIHIGDLKNILKHKENAIIVEPENSGALADAIYELWMDGALRKKIGENGKKLAKEIFDVRKRADEVEIILQGILPSNFSL